VAATAVETAAVREWIEYQGLENQIRVASCLGFGAAERPGCDDGRPSVGGPLQSLSIVASVHLCGLVTVVWVARGR
jgi:hypothetical protein